MTVSEDLDRNDEVVTAVLTASRALVAVSARSLAEVEDRLTMTQFRTLVVLAEHDATNLRRLADRIGVAASTALRTVDRLIANDLATRHENVENRREVVLTLTPDGRQVVNAVTTRRRLEIARIVAGMSAATTQQLIEAFHAFSSAVGEPLAREGPPSSLGW